MSLSRMMAFSRDIAALTIESQQVIALRMMRIAGGGGLADRESVRMVSEKISTLAEAQIGLGIDLAFGRGHDAPEKTLALYRRKVKANLKRLG